MDSKLLKSYLRPFGLSEEESSVYIELLKLGEAYPSQLAKLTHLTRPSVYNYLDRLAQKRLLTWHQSVKGKIARIRDPKYLYQEVEQEREKYISMESAYKSLLPQLDVLKKRKDFSTDVKYYEGKEGIQQMITHTLQANKYLYGYSLYRRNEIAGESFMKDFRQKWVDSGLKDHVIVNDQDINKRFPKEVMVKSYLKHQDVRLYPKEDFYISNDIMIYNNIFAVASLVKEEPFGIEIINEEIVKTQMSIFNIMWRFALPLKWEG